MSQEQTKEYKFLKALSKLLKTHDAELATRIVDGEGFSIFNIKQLSFGNLINHTVKDCATIDHEYLQEKLKNWEG